MRKKFSTGNSYRVYQEALRYLPAGSGSNARIWGGVCPLNMPCTIFIDRAKGPHVWDVDGNRYIDYRLGYGPVILGHARDEVDDAVERALREGAVYALGNELEVELAKVIVKSVPCVDMVRYCNSGTEATMSAIRLARAFTKKDIILKFEGHYHGGHDYMLFSTDVPFDAPRRTPVPKSPGIPAGMDKYVMVEEWNDFAGVERTIKRHHRRIAAVICEPLMGNASGIMPQRGFLEHLRELCTKHDVLLIFDEVKTGFRLALGGAAERFGVKPDLVCYAKSLGNGYPLAAFGGRRDIMSLIGPGKVFHGGTYSANPISMAAGLATLRELRKEGTYDALRKFGESLRKGMHEMLIDHNVPHLMLGTRTIMQVCFTHAKEIHSYRDLEQVEWQMYADLHVELLKRGIMIDEDNQEVIFTSLAHGKKELAQTLVAFDAALDQTLKMPAAQRLMSGKKPASHLPPT